MLSCVSAVLTTAVALVAVGRGAILAPPSFPWSNSRGVNIHYTSGVPGETKMLAEGFDGIRMDLHWAEVEKEKGVYDFSAFDILVQDLEKNGLQTRYLILDYSNELYCKGGEAP